MQRAGHAETIPPAFENRLRRSGASPNSAAVKPRMATPPDAPELLRLAAMMDESKGGGQAEEELPPEENL